MTYYGYNLNGESYCSHFAPPVIAALQVTYHRIGYMVRCGKRNESSYNVESIICFDRFNSIRAIVV